MNFPPRYELMENTQLSTEVETEKLMDSDELSTEVETDEPMEQMLSNSDELSTKVETDEVMEEEENSGSRALKWRCQKMHYPVYKTRKWKHPSKLEMNFLLLTISNMPLIP